MSLKDDIQAEFTKGRTDGCAACAAVSAQETESDRKALAAALAGTLSERAMIRIARNHQLGFGRATIQKHRTEGHTP